MKSFLSVFILMLGATAGVLAQAPRKFNLKSPDGAVAITVNIGAKTQWSVARGSSVIIAPSEINMSLQTGEVLGHNPKIASVKNQEIHEIIKTSFYKKSSVNDHCNQLTISFKDRYGLIFRAYNEGVAYRFFTSRKDSLIITHELSSFCFTEDHPGFVPYVTPSRTDRFEHSYENKYRHVQLSAMAKDSLAYLPIMFGVGDMKIVITEADLEDYPGLYLKPADSSELTLTSDFPTYPLGEKQGGYNMTQARVTGRAPYIAHTTGSRNFPWRVLAIAPKDKDLLNSDLVFKLAAPLRLTDTSWIKPGKVAWDWWNDWNLSHVDFKAGINTQTYKYYIDFAAAHHIEYVLLDEGWAEKGDIMKIVKDIDLQKIIDYGKQKNVGIWLWGGMYPVNAKMDEAFSTYAKMGVKGFKIDFINRDDQLMMQFYYRAARKAAEHHLMLDFHGACKPTGLMRTYPNVLNYEGVYGLEMAKFPTTVNFPEHAVSIPFIRMVAGAMDYTPGAMRNATRKEFYPSAGNPMSQGTRCQQLAMYVVFEAPFEMLADSPTAYLKEEECTDFITSIPTVFDETVALDGKVGNYAAIARRKGTAWYAGALNNWDERDITIDLSFLGPGNYKADIFEDGINANHAATDYKHRTITVTSSTKLNVHLANGGGWTAKFVKE